MYWLNNDNYPAQRQCVVRVGQGSLWWFLWEEGRHSIASEQYATEEDTAGPGGVVGLNSIRTILTVKPY